MSTVEEAASLFGSAESDSDIFGSTLRNEGHNNGHNISAPTANEPVHADTDVDALFGAASTDDFVENTWPSSDTPQGYDYNNLNYSTSTSPGDSYRLQESGWHDPSQKWDTYGQPGTRVQGAYYNGQDYANSSDAYQSYQPPAHSPVYSTYNYDPSSESEHAYSSPPAQQVTLKSSSNSHHTSRNGAASSHDPYKPDPSPSNTYIPASTPASSSHEPYNTAPVYDPYKPKPILSDSYAPRSTPASGYDPHKPEGHSRLVPPSLSMYSQPSNDRSQIISTHKMSSLQSSISPAPPAVTAAAYRPKALNAYDPPLPPPKPKRTQSSWQRTQSPPILHNQSGYSSYGLPKSAGVNAPSPVPPPPPRSDSGSYRSHSINTSLPPPPRKYTNPPEGGVPSGVSHFEYSQMNGNNHHSTATDAAGGEPEYTTKSPPPISDFGSPPSVDNYLHQSFTSEPISREYSDVDPEGSSMDRLATAASPPTADSSDHSFGASWVSETRTVAPSTVHERYKSPVKPFTVQLAAETNVFDQPHPDEPISAAPSVPQNNSRDPYQPHEPGTTVSPPPRKEFQPLYGHQTSPPLNLARTSSPASIRSQPSQYERKQPNYDPYAPGNVKSVSHDPYALSNHMRSASNGSVLSMNFNPVDPYAPSSHFRQMSNESSDFGSYTSRYNYPERPPSTASDRLGAYNVLPAPAYPAYAPSPSLLGTNDPLGRAATRIPVFSFGFGGKVATCFHGASVLNTGFDVALSSRQSRDIRIYPLHKIISRSALEESTALYPGPLFSDPGSPTVGLVRSGVSAQMKSKKARVIKYLDERIEELSRGIGYLNSGQSEHGKAEGKLILVKLLRIMVENDGRLSGTAELDASVRAALIPRLVDSADIGIERFSTPADGLGGTLAATESPLAVHVLRPSHLDKIQSFLIHGERRQAYHYALDEKLWAHAMVIASSINKEAWQEVANEFIRTELGIKEAISNGHVIDLKLANSVFSTESNGRESLRVAYSLYAGQGATAVQALLPAKPLMKMGEGLQLLPPTPMTFITPMSHNFPGTTVATKIPPEILTKWTETVAMMISGPMSLDTSSALTTLGDYLVSNQWIEAAHACYLLSPQTSPLGGVGSPSTRIVLFGSASPHVTTTFSKDSDPIILSEIAEFALSLAMPSKGQEPFAGLQYLQPYRLIRAHSLAEMGHVQLATRYCEAITASLSRGSPYFTQTFIEQLSGLSDRLTAAPSLDKGGSWIGTKMTRPSIDKIGNWLEGHLTKFIAGEGDNSPNPEVNKPKLQQPQGPFSHYSTISSTVPSADPSPHSSSVNLVSSSGYQPPPVRTGSAMALRSSTGSPHLHINRSSSAMDHVRPHDRRSPMHHIGSSITSTTSSGQQRLTYGRSNGYGLAQEIASGLTTMENSPTNYGDAINKDGDPDHETSPWWSSTYSGGFNSQTPTATRFMQVPENEAESSGFISLMDNSPIISTPSAHNPSSFREEDEDEDDLGLGNNSSRSKQPTPGTEENGSASSEKPAASQPAKDDAAPESKPAAKGSWLSKWWRKDASPGPVKANLGEETAFYYDKELKRWVNKKAGAEPPKQTAPPPPPSRSQTTSPGRSGSNASPGLSHGPPPARPASAAAVDLSSPPRKSAPRMRSNLVPDTTTSAPPTPAMGTFHGTPPPPGRPKSQASKRPVRSRYVDVLQNPTPPPDGS